jgi:hypothetical protein
MVEERYKRQLQNQWGSPYCAKWYCHNCMTFHKQEALHHCQTCGTIRPDFTIDGKHDQNCFWSIKSDYPDSNVSKVDDEPKKCTHWEMAKDMIKNMPSISQKGANLVSAVYKLHADATCISPIEKDKNEMVRMTNPVLPVIGQWIP